MRAYFPLAFRPRGTASKTSSVRVYEEKPDANEAVREGRRLLVDHYVGMETVLRAGGFDKAAEVLRNSLPTQKRIQSGDLGEILGVEFLHTETDYRVPILKLRYKSDRETALHGNDIVAVTAVEKRSVILKGECKSRAKFALAHLTEAVSTLDDHGCRPNPSTLSFITKRLYEERRDDEAAFFRDLQSKSKLRLESVEHFVFVLCGNDPTSTLASMPSPARRIRKRWSACAIVSNHRDFVSSLFSSAHGERS